MFPIAFWFFVKTNSVLVLFDGLLRHNTICAKNNRNVMMRERDGRQKRLNWDWCQCDDGGSVGWSKFGQMQLGGLKIEVENGARVETAPDEFIRFQIAAGAEANGQSKAGETAPRWTSSPYPKLVRTRRRTRLLLLGADAWSTGFST